MNFFEQQEQALRKSRVLIVIYLLCICLIIGVIYAAVLLLFFLGLSSQGIEQAAVPFNETWWNPKLFFAVTMSTLTIIAFGTISKIYALSSGGMGIAESLGGIPVPPNTTDFLERRLLNVVEEMAIASGVPVPRVYLLPSESGINAFAAGSKIDNAVIGVTKGCLRLLSREELQGVIAHEFSHILNGDMRLNLRLIGVLSGLLILSQIGYWTFRLSAHQKRGRRSSGDGRVQIALFILGFIVMVTGHIGVVFSRLIKSAVSRQREFLADASAVQFTRNPDGIGGALKKIGGYQIGSILLSPKAEEASHMFFSSGLSSFSSLFATHPPLVTRIKKIDPLFDRKFSRIKEEELLSSVEESAKKEMDAVQDAFGGKGILTASSSILLAPVMGTTDTLLESIGTTDASHIAYAQMLRESIPEAVIEASHDPSDARSLICALLLVSSDHSNEKEFLQIDEFLDEEIKKSVLTLLPLLASMNVAFRIPLVEMCVPILKTLSSEQIEDFIKVVYQLITLDKKVSLFEYVLSKIITNRLQEKTSGGLFSRETSLEELSRECTHLLATIARYGGSGISSQEKTFADGLQEVFPSSAVSLSSIPALSFKDLDGILEALLGTSMQDRERLIKACFRTICPDKGITLEQAEIFRAIADTLEVPVPPVVV